MPYIRTSPNPSGAYPGPQSSPAPGLASISEALTEQLLAYNGFVALTISDDDVVTAVKPNMALWEAWRATLPPAADPEPTEMEQAQQDADEMNVDQEYRLTLLELGVTDM